MCAIQQNDVNVSFLCFIDDKFNSLYKTLKTRIRTNKPKLSWITYSLLKSIWRKNLLYRKSIQKSSKSNISNRNKLNALLRLAKQNYLSSQLDREKHNMKKKKKHGKFWTQFLDHPRNRFVTNL